MKVKHASEGYVDGKVAAYASQHAQYVKDAAKSADGKTLTLTKQDGTQVSFQGGGGGTPSDYSTVRTNAATGATHAEATGNPHGVTWDNLSGDKPTIPSAVVEETVSGWGFTKNTGTYSKPNGGIPYSDMSSGVQASLDKADSALQSHQSLDGYALSSDLPYSSASIPADRTCSTITVASTGASVTIPKPSTESKITAFCVYLDMTALTGTAPSIGFKYPIEEGETEAQDAELITRGGEGQSYETGAVNAVFFIQCGTKYIASAQVYK